MNANAVNNLSKNQRKRLRRKIRRDLQSDGKTSNTQLALVAPQQLSLQGPPVLIKSERAGRRRRGRRSRGGQGSNGSSPRGNYYLQSLMDPVNCPGAKIPDLCSFPTGTFQLTQEWTMTVAASADGCALIFSPIIGDVSGAVNHPFKRGFNAAVNGAYTFAGAEWSSRASIQAIYEQYRPVSAVLEVEYIGTSMNDSGVLCGGLLPRRTLVLGYTALVPTFDTFSSEEFTKTTSVREGLRVVWKPQDNMDFEFRQSTDGTNYQVFYPPAIAFAAAGMQPGAALRVTCIANFEGIPNQDTANIIQTGPSPIHIGMMQQALNWAGQAVNNVMPLVHNVSPFVRPMLSGAMAGLANSFSRRVANRAQQALTF